LFFEVDQGFQLEVNRKRLIDFEKQIMRIKQYSIITASIN